MKLREILNDIENNNLSEDLAYVKFKYSNFKNDPTPRVKALDFTYPGQEGQSTYGERDDILGWNLNYYSNPKEAEKTIDDIESFAKLLGADKEEKYKRIKHLFPEQAKLIRRYMRKHTKGLKMYDNGLWKKTTYSRGVQYNQNAF